MRPVALTVQRNVGTRGGHRGLPSLLDQSYFRNMQAKLGIEVLAFQLGASVELATSKFPVAHIAESNSGRG